ncbi:uncharacterized protein LOC132045316 [Lycium ferocissimum]|uniref:uncharacterized protein LOC132045316 n=1 Tax=Lycium ferocissimum TaxID=112874 RepID=UPI002815934B|nr:uncharacterized protein LOC132045316 [Lycium ferocissimum]
MNSDKVEIIGSMPDALDNVKMVQSLTGKVAALGRFISRATDGCHEFFKLTKKDHRFLWMQECDQSLRDLKAYLAIPHIMAKLEEREKLFVYIAVSKISISIALVRIEAEKQLLSTTVFVDTIFNEATTEQRIV